MSRAFVTGAMGFLGKRLCQMLQRRDCEVHSFSRADGDPCAALIAVRPDWVFHLAADSRRSREKTLLNEMFHTNVTGTLALLRAAPNAAFIAVGSFEEYGDNPAPFREDMAPRPMSPYGLTKAMASLLVAGMGQAVLRFPVLYGPGQASDSFIGAACAAVRARQRFAMTKGEQSRDFLFVDDAAEALIVAAEQFSKCRGEIFNVCSGKAITLADAVQMIGAGHLADEGALPYRAQEQMHYAGDPAKFINRTGWNPRISFADGITLTLNA
jgi:UDP-glucose 4-epimerase